MFGQLFATYLAALRRLLIPFSPCVRATGYCRAMAQCALQRHSAGHSARYGSGSWVCNPVLISRAKTPISLKFQLLPAPQVTLPMSGKIANILGPHYGWSLWKNEDLVTDLVEFFAQGLPSKGLCGPSWKKRSLCLKQRRSAAGPRLPTAVGGGLCPAPEDSEEKVLLRALCM